MIKQELDECKENYENLNKTHEKLKKDNDDKLSKIQELNFAKAHLTELIVDNENRIHNLEVEKDSFEKHCFTLKDERNMLREYIEKISSDSSSEKEFLEKENKSLKEKLKEAEGFIIKKDENIKKLNIELESLKSSTSNMNDKIKNLENTLKSKINDSINFESKGKELKDLNSQLEEIKSDLERENENLKENLNSVNRQIQNLEKENLELMKKNKTLLISQESFQADLVKQNQNLQNTENKLKEQIGRYNIEIEKLRDEKEDLKKMMNDAIGKCSSLIKEKSDIEKELNRKSLQIENLKNANILLHKNFSMKSKDKSDRSERSDISHIKENQLNEEDQKIVKLGESKIEETSMINLIRREKEKNKEFLEEIKRMKNNI